MFTAQELHDEITTDPKGLGYGALLAAGDDEGVATLLNSTYAGVGIVYRPNLPAHEILGSLVAAEVAGWTQVKWVAFTALISTGTVDATNPNIRALFQQLVGAGTASLANMNNAAKVTSPTRAEELWGAGTIITSSDVGVAKQVIP